MSKKVAIIGAQNCGKTTSLYYLCYKLKKRNIKLGVGHEVARECPYPLNAKGGLLTQLWILFKQMEREAKLEGYYEDIIIDRSVFDCVPYCDQLTRWGIIKRKDSKFVSESAFAWAKNHPYSLLVYLEPLSPETNTKNGSGKYQTSIVEHFERLLKKIDTPIKRVDIAPKDERCKKVYKIVKRHIYG